MADAHDDLVAVLRAHGNGGERPSRPASAQAADRLEELADRVADLEQDNEGLSRHVGMMERHRMGEQRALTLLRDALDAIDGLLPMLDKDAPNGLHAGEFVRRGALRQAGEALRHLVDGQPTDEPTEADPVEVAAEAIRLHSNGSAHGSASVAVAALRTAGLVGGRSAAPTRDEIVAALRTRALGVPHEADELRSIYVRDAADAMVALLSRSATEPPEDRTVMAMVAGRSFVCEACSANVFVEITEPGDVKPRYRCNGCGAEYEGTWPPSGAVAAEPNEAGDDA